MPPARVNAAGACPIDEIGRLFEQRAAHLEQITTMLDACTASGSTDPRIFIYRGILARDRGDLTLSATLLEQARAADPASTVAMLELAVTYEWQKRYAAADTLYREVLAVLPDNRPALLGRARIARVQHRDGDAAAIYHRLLTADPHDVEALTGLGWLGVDRHDAGSARSYFTQALAIEPGYTDARNGLEQTRFIWNDRLEIDGGWTNTANGIAWSESALFTARTGINDLLDAGILHNSSELPGVGFPIQQALPLNDYHVDWEHKSYDTVSWSFAYDNRPHTGLPTEQWASASVAANAAANLRLFLTYRDMFGGPQWNGYLTSLGGVVGIGNKWFLQATGFAGGYHQESVTNQFGPLTTTGAADIEFQRQLRDNSDFSFGVGYNPTIGSVATHANAHVPLSPKSTLVISAFHQTAVPQTLVTIGNQFSW